MIAHPCLSERNIEFQDFRKNVPSSEGLNHFLDQMKSEGGHDSQGEFTLSLEKAAEKLKKFQLTDPNLFMLNLVACAVLRGASYFSVNYSDDVLRVSFDGQLFERTELESIFYSQEHSQRELAVALTAAKSLEPSTLLFESSGSLSWEEETPSFSQASETKNAFILVEKVSRPTSFFARRPAHRANAAWEFPLQSSCMFAPLELTLNHRRLNQRKLQVRTPAFVIHGPGAYLPELVKVGRNDSVVSELSTQHEFSAVIGPRANEWARTWSFVVNGVTFTRPATALPFPGLGGVVFTSKLQKNLSHSDLVEDDNFTELVKELEVRLEEFVRRHLSLMHLDEESTKHWVEPGLQVGKALYERGENREAARIEAWAYGQKAKHGATRPAGSTNFAGRYQEPLVFLLDFLHWCPTENLAHQLRLLSGQIRKADGELLVPWLSNATPQALKLLFAQMAPAFPGKLEWDVFQPLLQAVLETDFAPEVLQFLQNKTENLSKWLNPSQRKGLLLSADLLHSKGRLDFKDWLSNALQEGGLEIDASLSEWIKECRNKELAEQVVAEQSKKMRVRSLATAQARFSRFLKEPGTHFNAIRGALSAALKETREADTRADLLALFNIFETHSSRSANSNGLAWHTHRVALVIAVADRDWKRAETFHHQAHQKLQDHWFSHLLLANIALAQDDRTTATTHYQRSLHLYPSSSDAREGLIEVSPQEARSELWVARARSQGVSDLESYLAYQDALHDFSHDKAFREWVKLRALTSFAQNKAGDVPSLSRSRWLAQDHEFVFLALTKPAVVRAHLRDLRRRGNYSEAGAARARFRLAQQLSLSVNHPLEWKMEFRDSDETRLELAESAPELPPTTPKPSTKFKPLR